MCLLSYTHSLPPQQHSQILGNTNIIYKKWNLKCGLPGWIPAEGVNVITWQRWPLYFIFPFLSFFKLFSTSLKTICANNMLASNLNSWNLKTNSEGRQACSTLAEIISCCTLSIYSFWIRENSNWDVVASVRWFCIQAIFPAYNSKERKNPRVYRLCIFNSSIYNFFYVCSGLMLNFRGETNGLMHIQLMYKRIFRIIN